MQTQFNDWLALQNEQVIEHSEVVTNAALGQDYLLHIDKNPIPVFWPMMPRSANEQEDNTVARITVSPHILGCFIGYCSPGVEQSRAHSEFTAGPDRPDVKDPYRGGYLIHSLKFQYALKIKNQLVPTAQESSEHWLTTYSEETKEYPSVLVGKVFIGRVEQIAVSGQPPRAITTLYIEVHDEDGLLLTDELFLPKGYHSVSIDWDHLGEPAEPGNERIQVQTLTSQRYQTFKTLHATLLSERGAPADYAVKTIMADTPTTLYVAKSHLNTPLRAANDQSHLVGYQTQDDAIRAQFEEVLQGRYIVAPFSDDAKEGKRLSGEIKIRPALPSEIEKLFIYLYQIEVRVPDGWQRVGKTVDYRTSLAIEANRVITVVRINISDWMYGRMLIRGDATSPSVKW